MGLGARLIINLMKKQISISPNKNLPQLNSQLLERYNSLPRIHLKNSIENSSQCLHSYKSERSIASRSQVGRKIYVSKSPLFFKKLHERDNNDGILQKKADFQLEKRTAKRTIDINFVLEQSKKRFDTKINHRLIERNDSIMKLSHYEGFSPFKRGHQILRKINKVQGLNPQSKNDTNNFTSK